MHANYHRYKLESNYTIMGKRNTFVYVGSSMIKFHLKEILMRWREKD